MIGGAIRYLPSHPRLALLSVPRPNPGEPRAPASVFRCRSATRRPKGGKPHSGGQRVCPLAHLVDDLPDHMSFPPSSCCPCFSHIVG